MQISSHNTNEFSGDSTTTSTIIAHAIQNEGLKYLNAGFNPVLMKRGIEKASREIIQFLEDTKYMFDYSKEVFSKLSLI
jgi:chaperonin GroEL